MGDRASTSHRAERVLFLLRGINVGGRHPLPMAMLRGLFEELGYSGVATYMQSGNLVATAPARPLDEARIATALEERFGFAVPVVSRCQAEMDAVLSHQPFTGSDAAKAHWHCLFLPEPLSATSLTRLAGKIAGQEALEARGREVFLYLPHGTGRSKLAAAVSAAPMSPAATLRNWRTVLQLQSMLAL